MPTMPAGRRVHAITIETPGVPVPDGDGGYTQTWTPVTAVYASIMPATVRDLERLRQGTVIAQASHVVTLPYVTGVTTKARVVFGARTFAIVGVATPEERPRELVLLCSENVP